MNFWQKELYFMASSFFSKKRIQMVYFSTDSVLLAPIGYSYIIPHFTLTLLKAFDKNHLKDSIFQDHRIGGMFCFFDTFFQKISIVKKSISEGVFGSADHESDIGILSKMPSVPRYTIKMSTFLNIDFCNFIGISEHIINYNIWR